MIVRIRLPALLVAAAGALAAAAACSSDSTPAGSSVPEGTLTDPDSGVTDEPPDGGEAGAPGERPGASDSGPSSSDGAAHEAGTTVTQAGGTVTGGGGRVTIDVPAGAVASDETLTIDRVDDPPAGGLGPAYELGPDGTQFNAPITVTLELTEPELGAHAPEALTVATWDGARWVPLRATTVLNDGGRVEVAGLTTHFTIFTIIPKTGDPCACEADCWAKACAGSGGLYGDSCRPCLSGDHVEFIDIYADCVGTLDVPNFCGGDLQDCCVSNGADLSTRCTCTTEDLTVLYEVRSCITDAQAESGDRSVCPLGDDGWPGSCSGPDGICDAGTSDTGAPEAGPRCGNGVIETGEDCDGASLGGQTCASVDPSNPEGELACGGDCSFDTSGCAPECPSTESTCCIGPDCNYPWTCPAGTRCGLDGQCAPCGCGNGTCDSWEDCSSCPADCGCSTGQFCDTYAGQCEPCGQCTLGSCTDSDPLCNSDTYSCQCGEVTSGCLAWELNDYQGCP